VSFNLYKINRGTQCLLSTGFILFISGICFLFQGVISYKLPAFVLLLSVSLIAVIFDIIPVLLAAFLSALTWDFFFIPPRFTFRVTSAEDALLLLMYFVIALINSILTHRIRRFEKLARQKEEKANTIKLYNTLFNSLSHELKTPLATIVGAADNLLNEPSRLSDVNRKNLVAEISMASLRLNRQVENLLNMSRLESGFLQPKKDWCDMNEMIYEVVNRLEANLESYDLKIMVEENLPLYKLDHGLVEQVLYNLIYNATIYTPEFSELFIIAKNNSNRIYRLDPDDTERSRIARETDGLTLIIEDRGPGFPEDELEKVFDKFYRLKNSKTGGTGLGLSIVKGFVEAHQGVVILENVPHGARFTIEIPAEVSYIKNLKNE
jgi:two-component system sensor histidine kinase KdpD